VGDQLAGCFRLPMDAALMFFLTDDLIVLTSAGKRLMRRTFDTSGPSIGVPIPAPASSSSTAVSKFA